MQHLTTGAFFSLVTNVALPPPPKIPNVHYIVTYSLTNKITVQLDFCRTSITFQTALKFWIALYMHNYSVLMMKSNDWNWVFKLLTTIDGPYNPALINLIHFRFLEKR